MKATIVVQKRCGAINTTDRNGFNPLGAEEENHRHQDISETETAMQFIAKIQTADSSLYHSRDAICSTARMHTFLGNLLTKQRR